MCSESKLNTVKAIKRHRTHMRPFYTQIDKPEITKHRVRISTTTSSARTAHYHSRLRDGDNAVVGVRVRGQSVQICLWSRARKSECRESVQTYSLKRFYSNASHGCYGDEIGLCAAGGRSRPPDVSLFESCYFFLLSPDKVLPFRCNDTRCRANDSSNGRCRPTPVGGLKI